MNGCNWVFFLFYGVIEIFESCIVTKRCSALRVKFLKIAPVRVSATAEKAWLCGTLVTFGLVLTQHLPQTNHWVFLTVVLSLLEK